MVEVSVLASGSSGNCFFYQGNGSAYLIDAGISCRQVCERLSKIKKNIRSIKGIFITHEHSDHVKGLQVISKMFHIPIYISKGTLDSLKFHIGSELVNIITPGKKINIDGTIVDPFLKCHDAAEPVSYSMTFAKKTASFITDIGIACDTVKEHVRNSDVLVLESNHDIEMLKNGRYPYYLKKRILSDDGHISNYDSALLVLEHAKSRLEKLYLSHLSENNNTPDLAMSTFRTILRERKDLKGLDISITYREKPNKILDI